MVHPHQNTIYIKGNLLFPNNSLFASLETAKLVLECHRMIPLIKNLEAVDSLEDYAMGVQL
jgi:hypothetical protein